MNTELRVIRTLTVNPDSRAAQDLLSKIDASFFATSVGREAFKICSQELRKNSQLPYWDDLISNPRLDESIRDVLEDSGDVGTLKSKKITRKAIDRLAEYRKLRSLSKLGSKLADALNSTDAINVDELVSESQQILNNARSAKNFKVLRIGKNSNVSKHIKKVLKGEAQKFIPTGFNGFDKYNRGIPLGSYFLIAAPTGTGKSAMINQVAENMARNGAKVGVAPLEMINIEMLQRNLARVTDTDMLKFLDPKSNFNKEHKRDIYKKFMKFDRKIAKVGGAIEYYEFDEDITIENLTSTVKPFGLDVLAIDYLGLLEGTQGDNQWQALGNVARFLHVWGKANDIITIAAAQLSDEGMLRYSKQMAEHAKFFWYWKSTDANKSSGIYDIVQRKARQASDHTFQLKFDPTKMTWRDPSEEEIEEFKQSEESSRDGKTSKYSSKWKKKSSVGWDDEEDNEIEPEPGKRAQDHVKKKKKKKSKAKEVEL